MSYISYVKARGFNRSSEEIALDLINYFNQTTLDTFDFTYGKTQVVDVLPEVKDDEDTFVSVVVDTDDDERFSSHFDFRQDGFLYKRLDISVLLDNAIPSVHAPGEIFTTLDILGQINYQLQSQLSEKDVIVETYSVNDLVVNVKISPYSLVWLGSFSVNMDQSLKTVVVRRTQNGQLRTTTVGFTRNVV